MNLKQFYNWLFCQPYFRIYPLRACGYKTYKKVFFKCWQILYGNKQGRK